MVDPIADMLTRIRNAVKAGHPAVSFRNSKIKFEIAKILKHENYIEDFRKVGRGAIKNLEISLKYPTPISEIKRISSWGQRVYVGAFEIKPVKSGHGLVIISTSKGLMTGKDARKAGLGGEVLLEIW